MIPMTEQLVFEALKAFLQVGEPARLSDSLKFSWNNYRQDGLRILARLDRFYIFQSLPTTYRQIIAYKIRGDTGWSDHMPVELSLQLQGRPRSSRWHMNTFHLDMVLPELSRLWQEQPSGATFFSKV